MNAESSITQLPRLNLAASGRFAVRAENVAALVWGALLEFKPDLTLLNVMPGMDRDGGGLGTRAAPAACKSLAPSVPLAQSDCR